MAFSPEQVEEFIAAVHADPLLRDRMREAILADDFLALPGIVRSIGERLDRLTARVDALAQEQQLLGQRLDRLTERVDRLTESVAELVSHAARTDERLDRLTESVNELVAHAARADERLDRIDERFNQVDERFRQVDQRFDRVERRLDKMQGDIGNLQGEAYETRYLRNLGAHLGAWYRHVRSVVLADMDRVAAALRSGLVSRTEWEQLMSLDVAALGTPADQAGGAEVLVVLELSKKVDQSEVRRVYERAEVLRRLLDLRVDACVDGEEIEPGAQVLADQLGVRALVFRAVA
jgi:prefoldin subunit 5